MFSTQQNGMTNSFFLLFGVYRVLEKSSSYFLLHLKYIYNNDWLAIHLRRCPRSSLLINLQSNRFLCAVWKDRKICPETSRSEPVSDSSHHGDFFFFTLIINNLALTYSLKYDNANKMRQCENIFVFIDLTKSIGSDLGGQCPPAAPPPKLRLCS